MNWRVVAAAPVSTMSGVRTPSPIALETPRSSVSAAAR
jgi:hypothetical protein